jgi:electron transfer flavoprotein beta subunit
VALRIAVCVAQVGLLAEEVHVPAGALTLDPGDLDLSLNEWDAYAVEEALRQRDLHGGEVLVLTAADGEGEAALRRALAMGADRAIRVWSPWLEGCAWDALALSAALGSVLAQETPDLVLCGMQSSDGGAAATGTATAARLGLPVETCVIGLEWRPAEGLASVRRELEGGRIEVREVQTPALLTIQSGINEPRYVTFRAIKAAERLEIAVREAPSASPGAAVRGLSVPAAGPHADMVQGSPAEVAARIAAVIRGELEP